MPMIATLDLHANVSAAMVEACDALIAYRSNPHLDQRQRGLEAARLMVRTLKGEVKPTMAASLLPLAVNIERQLTSQPPCQPMYALADAQLDKPGVLSNSLVLGFPYADVAEMGSSAIVVTHNDPGLARRMVDDLAQAWWDRRREFDGQFITIDEALDRAEKLKGPVCLLDMGDNVGGGSPADATLLAHALYKRRYPASFVCLFDPESVVQASAAGVGRRVSLWVGGKTDAQHGPPLQADFTVRGLYEGKFRESQPRHGGFTEFDQGPTAVVETDAGLTVMLTTRRMVPMSLRQLDSCGLQPANFRFLVAKGVHAPVAAYREVCNDFIRVDTPGVTRADMRQLTYHHRRRPMEPFEQGMTWSASTHQ
jgi:microcystin degradation protein MlrC